MTVRYTVSRKLPPSWDSCSRDDQHGRNEDDPENLHRANHDHRGHEDEKHIVAADR